MTEVFQAAGLAKASWNIENPLKWEMSEPRRRNGITPDPIVCDLSSLAGYCAMEFLTALKEALIDGRHFRQIRTISRTCFSIKRVIEIVHSNGYQPKAQISRFDEIFVTGLFACVDEIPKGYLNDVRYFYKTNGQNENIFSPNLSYSDFKVGASRRGVLGDRMHRILGLALKRAALVHILSVCEDAFENKTLDLGKYAFLRLCLNAYCRPESYRRLLLGDFLVDIDPESNQTTHFILIHPPKTSVNSPEKIPIRLNKEVGKLLEMQRSNVVKRFSELAPKDDANLPILSRLPLFPATQLRSGGKSWVSAYANANFGMHSSTSLREAYLAPIGKICSTPISFNALRHTIGTQLAQAGCSSQSIQSVLKHASPTTCQAYVDIAFQGLIDDLSDSLEPAFSRSFPIAGFVSKNDFLPAERRIDSEDVDEGGLIETTGICGRRVACRYAPITCYGCSRFNPCYDADHQINLDIVEREMREAKNGGLAMQEEYKRCRSIAFHIKIVMVACDVKKAYPEAMKQHNK